MLQIGGHHLAHNIVYLSGSGYPVPHHVAVEPKASFAINSETYSPMLDDGEALVAIYDSMDSSQLSSAYLAGQSFADVVLGPDNGSTSLGDYPDQEGVLVSSLSAAQQALVRAAIAHWVGDYADDISDALIADYTSDEAFAQTYVAWAGDESAGVDVDHSGTYLRIDGPRVWIEVACQGGIVIRGETHYHSIYRDKTQDYGNSL